MIDYDQLVTAMTLLPKGEPLFSEMALTVRLEDEGAGLFVVIEQEATAGMQKISVTQEEWPHLVEIVNRFMAVCQERNAKESS